MHELVAAIVREPAMTGLEISLRELSVIQIQSKLFDGTLRLYATLTRATMMLLDQTTQFGWRARSVVSDQICDSNASSACVGSHRLVESI